MNDPLHQPIETYLQQVAAQLGGRGERERGDVLDALRRHIHEALRARSATPTAADVEAVLMTMDAPEDYADPAPAEPVPARPPAPRGGADKWFLLALCFLALNGWLAWRLTRAAPGGPAVTTVAGATFEAGTKGRVGGRDVLRWRFERPLVGAADLKRVATNVQASLRPAVPGTLAWVSEAELVFQPAGAWPACTTYEAELRSTLALPTGHVFSFQSAPLRLQEVVQMGISPNREVSLRLIFNATPVVQALDKFLRITDAAGKPVSYTGWREGAVVSNSLLLTTAPVLAGDQLNIVLAAGLAPVTGTLGTPAEGRFELSLREGLELSEVRPQSPAFEAPVLECVFTELIAADAASTFIETKPPVKITVEPYEHWRGDGCRVRGDFVPGQIYAVTFKPGLSSVNGHALTRPLTRQVQFPNRPSSLAFATAGHYLSPGGSLRVPLSAMNVREVELRAASILPQNLVQFVMRESGRYNRFYSDSVEDWADQLTARAAAVTSSVTTVLNREARVPADLRQLIGGTPSGAYLVSASAPGTEVDAVHQLVVVTDLGLSARHARDGWLVWINSLRAARPLSGVEVVLYAENGAELARGETGADGTAFLGVPPADDEATPILILARRGDDLSYLKLTGTELPPPAGGDRPYLSGAYEASVFTDRGIYRPGETLHARALVRDRKLACPAPFPAVFRVRQPDGRIFRTVPVTLNEYGAAELGCELPTYLPSGGYQIELCLPGTFTELGATAVSLEDFVPPQIRVDVTPPAERQLAGEAFDVAVLANHLFGRPAAGLSAQGRASIEATAFVATNWPGFVFGDAEKSFSRVEMAMGRAVLDAEGKATLHLELLDGWRPPAALKAVVGVTVTEASGRPVSRYASVPVDAYPFYVGLRRAGDGGAVVAGATQHVAVVAVQPDGQAVEEACPLKAVFSSVQYSTVLKRGPDGRYSYESSRTLTPLREQLISVGKAPATVDIAPPTAGEYVLVVSDPESGASSSLNLTAAARGQSWVTWSRERPDLLPLEADRELYHPGDLARVTIKAPFAGTALLTVESDRIHEQRVLTFTGNTAVIDVPVRADYAPTVFCHVTLIRPAVAETVWSAHRACGAVLLTVEPAGRRITATVEAPPVTRPQAPLDAVIRLADEAGRPVVGEVTVAAVDEAICMLTDFETPDPMDDFLAPRLPGVGGFDLYSLLMPVTDDSAFGASAPGGDGSGSLRRRLNPINARRFRPVALWQSNLRTDSNGVARVHFDVPEFTGELRLMAVAWNRDRAGSAQAAVKVKRPLVVQSALPRFLAPGDRCQASVQVFNESGRALAGTLRMTTGGPLTVDQPQHALDLAVGQSVNERFAVQAGDQPGVALVTVEAEAGGEKFRETIELAVRPALAPQVTARVGKLAAGEKIELRPPTNWIASTAVQTIRASGRPEARLGRALNYLLRYPYGCLEQTVSGAFPLLRLPELAGGAIGREETERLVRAAILRVLSMQRERGFVLWPQSTVRHEWAGVYATHFLVEARRAGFDVPEDRFQAALQWLRDRLDESVAAEADSPDWLDDMEIRAYACHVLARAGKPETGWIARLNEQGPRLTAGARAHVAAALLLSGQPQLARERLARTPLPDLALQPGARVTLRSGARDAGLLLCAWLDVDPASSEAAALADFLLRAQVDGHWGSTQDDAWALLALGDYAARTRAAPQAVKGSLASAAGVQAFDQKGITVTNVAGAVTLSNAGPGDVYYAAQLEGVPTTGTAEEGDHGLAVRRTWLDLEGNPLDVTKLRQGDLIVVKLTLDTQGGTLDNLVIEDLLPAGLEIENPSLATAQAVPWIKEKTDWCLHRELRDDRFLLFSGYLSGPSAFYYAARAVSPGRFVVPALSASAMYAPGLRSVNGSGTMEVQP